MPSGARLSICGAHREPPRPRQGARGAAWWPPQFTAPGWLRLAASYASSEPMKCWRRQCATHPMRLLLLQAELMRPNMEPGRSRPCRRRSAPLRTAQSPIASANRSIHQPASHRNGPTRSCQGSPRRLQFRQSHPARRTAAAWPSAASELDALAGSRPAAPPPPPQPPPGRGPLWRLVRRQQRQQRARGAAGTHGDGRGRHDGGAGCQQLGLPGRQQRGALRPAGAPTRRCSCLLSRIGGVQSRGGEVLR